MSAVIYNSTPREDGFYMPAEYHPQSRVWMIWPERPDNWRMNAVPAQKAYAETAIAISRFTPVTMLASGAQLQRCRAALPGHIDVKAMSSDDAWCRDTGPSFLINGRGDIRACDWTFNSWGGHVDGLYDPWDEDDRAAGRICEMAGIDRYRTEGFVLEGGSFHVDGEGTVLTTSMCLLSKGRNPGMSKSEIEEKLKDYLGCEKVLWLKDGIDPEETNGHVDDIACFVRPGEAACIYTEDETHPFYRTAKETCEALESMTDARGRKLLVHRITLTKYPVYLEGADTIKRGQGTLPRKDGDLCAASYLNFLITNGGVIVPQFGDPYDGLALEQLRDVFPDRTVVGVNTREIVYGGGNIHCITQQQPEV